MEKEFEEIDSKNSWGSVYQKIRHKSGSYDYTCKDARRTDNKNLNRYRDVNPYDHSRVILKRGDKDYINASLVKVNAANRTYILTQGPLPATTSHFWLMVWEQESKAILMLNRIIEKNTVKCHQYWPMGKEHGGDDDLLLLSVGLKVTFLKETPATNYTVRELLLTDLEGGQQRVVLHFHYITWPDFGVPESPGAFLAFLGAVRESGALEPDVGPPVVHCSAGIGRSGTFCLVDSCLVLIEANGCRMEQVNVQEMLLEMRKFRMGLIQTPDQLRFSYLAIIQGAKRLKGDSLLSLTTSPADSSSSTFSELLMGGGPSAEQNGMTSQDESSETDRTDSSDDEDEGDDDVRDSGNSSIGSALPPVPPPLPPRMTKRSSEDEGSNSSTEAKEHKSRSGGKEEEREIESPQKSEREEVELRRRLRKERLERTANTVQRMQQKQRSCEAWARRRVLFKRVSLGLVLLLGTGVLVYKLYGSGTTDVPPAKS